LPKPNYQAERRRKDWAKKARKEEKRLRKKETNWEWRKKYRVWEANRKVFVYPENWIEPDLRMPDACLVSLREVVAAVRAQSGTGTQRARNLKVAHRKGVGVLLTGKNQAGTLVTAQTLARDLGMDLYRIDLSHVVSKYIGETEKNISRLFDTAKTGGAVLLFDEADALFGKRSEVKDSHDRYANIEVNYLLQRIENFGGLAILSIDRRDDLDNAFLRRFHFVIGVPPL
jgi:ATP-dependent 26S proteasome regulatory subunit